MKYFNCLVCTATLSIISVLIISCSGSGHRSDSKRGSTSTERSVGEDSYAGVDGTYLYEDNSVRLMIRVSGNSWSGKTILISGFGAAYDNENAQYDNGIMKGSDLYESSGNIKIGEISGNSLTTSMGGQQVTLSR